MQELIVLFLGNRLKNRSQFSNPKLASEANYLQFIIDNFYCHFKDKSIALAICDTKKVIRFITDIELKLYSLSLDDVKGKQLTEINSFEKFTPSVKKDEQAKEYVLTTGNTATVIIFDKYEGLIGAVHKYYQPIFTPSNKICGLTEQTYDYTKLFWGARNLSQNKNTNSTYDFNLLTLRQQQILLLLAFDISQEDIATNLSISRGGVARSASRICKSFNLPFSSTNLLLDTLGRENIINNLSLQHMKFEPCTVLLKNDWKILKNLSGE